MADCHKKMTFREFRALDACEDFRCKECGWTVEIRGWMKGLFYIGLFVVLLPLGMLLVWLWSVWNLEGAWRLLPSVPTAAAVSYVYLHVAGY
jgi:hypothetical protein